MILLMSDFALAITILRFTEWIDMLFEKGPMARPAFEDSVSEFE
jgi:hypothetical protein